MSFECLIAINGEDETRVISGIADQWSVTKDPQDFIVGDCATVTVHFIDNIREQVTQHGGMQLPDA